MYVRLLGLLPLLASCSLINSYDEVVEGGAGAAGGGEPTGSSTSSAGGGNTGGGGGADVTPLDCQLVGDPDELLNLATEPQGLRQFRDRGYAWQPNGDQLRLVAQVGEELRGYEVSASSGTLTGQSWVLPNVDDMMDARLTGNQSAGILVARRPVTQGDPIPVELHTVGNSGFQNVGSFPIVAMNSDNGVRGRFVYVGPEQNRIDLLLRTGMGAVQSVAYFKHAVNGTNSMPVALVPDMPFNGAEDANPSGLIRTSTGRVHAFVGEPDDGGPGVRHWAFQDTATTSGPMVPLGGMGLLFLDTEPAGNGLVNIALAQITMTTLGARVGKVPEAKLDNLTLADLHPAKEFESFLDIPTSGRPALLGDMLPLFGANQSKTEFMLILSRTTDGAVRFDKPDFLEPSTPLTIFGSLGLIATDDPVIHLGGFLYIFYAERENPGMPDEYDRLMMATVTCEPET